MSERLPEGPSGLTAGEAGQAFARDQLTPGQLIEALVARIEAREATIGAWQHLDWRNVERQLGEVEKLREDQRGPLWGLPVGIKDIFDTFDMPTSYGSQIYRGNRPAGDAACVARLRAAGAIILGKTVSTEFAYWKAGRTRNPHAPVRSPGGSSSGSAAAVADHMVPLAIGSQTAASTIRPAAYCGIIGFKPTRGRISLQGVKALANGLDTVGVFARTVSDVARLAGVMMGRTELLELTAASEPPVVRVWHGPEWHEASEAARESVHSALRSAAVEPEGEGGNLPGEAAALCQAQTLIMAFEAARELAHERRTAWPSLSASLHQLIATGEAIEPDEVDAAYALRDRCLGRIEEIFSGADLLALPSAPDVAPRLSEGTGDPVMSRAWTLLGLPSLSLPFWFEDEALPRGLQLAARPGADLQLLSFAARLTPSLARRPL